MAHLHLSHKTDLREMVPGFPMAEEIPDDIDICQLIAKFSDYAEAIAAFVDVEQVIKDAPLGVDYVPLFERRCNKVWALQLFDVSADRILCAW